MIKNICLITVFTLAGCTAPTQQQNNSKITGIADTSSHNILPETSSKNKGKTDPINTTHLHDTLFVSGNTVVFLQPDSIRFQSLSTDENSGIYEADSDFGFGISTTLKALAKHKKYNEIRTAVSEKRFVLFTDCREAPVIIDRDTVDYGVLLSAPGRDVQSNTFINSSGYFPLINEYFTSNK